MTRMFDNHKLNKNVTQHNKGKESGGETFICKI